MRLFDRQQLRSPAVSLIPLLLFGCGGSEATAPSFTDTIDSARTLIVANDAIALMERTLDIGYDNQGNALPIPLSPAAEGAFDPFATAERLLGRMGGAGGADPLLVLPPVAWSIPIACPRITGADSLGHPIDADADGIADHLVVDFGHDCSKRSGGFLITWSGSYTITDGAQGWGSYTFLADHLARKYTDTLSGDFVKETATGTESMAFTPTHAAHDYAVEFLRAGVIDSMPRSLTFDFGEHSTFDPDSGVVFAPHAGIPSGTLTYALDYAEVGVGVPGEDVHFLISTPTPLHYSNGCDSWFDGGVLQGLLNGNASTGFAWSWTGCAAPTLTMFGTTPAEP